MRKPLVVTLGFWVLSSEGFRRSGESSGKRMTSRPLSELGISVSLYSLTSYHPPGVQCETVGRKEYSEVARKCELKGFSVPRPCASVRQVVRVLWSLSSVSGGLGLLLLGQRGRECLLQSRCREPIRHSFLPPVFLIVRSFFRSLVHLTI